MNNEGMSTIERPLVSVITPIYNSEKYLERMINSVISQTYVNWELILVNDASTDSSDAIIAKYVKVDSRIRSFRFDTNKGSGEARNEAMRNAFGVYLAFLDADDIWLPRKLEVQTAVMIEKGFAFTFTSFGYISRTNSVVKSVREAGVDPIDYGMLVRGRTIGCLTVMLDVEKVGVRKMPNIRVKQDYALWADILKDGHVAEPINEALSLYRLTDGSATSNKTKLIFSHYRLLRDNQNLSIFISLYGVFCWGLRGLHRSLMIKLRR